MGELAIKKRLTRYLSLKMQNENNIERVERMLEQEEFPTIKEGDGSQRSIFITDRISAAIARRVDLERKIDDIAGEMRRIEQMVDAMENPMESEVLRLRYIDGDNCRLTIWTTVSRGIYGDDDENHVRATYRLHGHALQSLEKQLQDSER